MAQWILSTGLFAKRMNLWLCHTDFNEAELQTCPCSIAELSTE